MTRLDAMRALLELPAIDTLTRTSNAIYSTPDAEKLRIEVVRIKAKPRRRKAKSSRISWLRGVHNGQKGA
jgi:hypothetical protein